MRLLSLAAILLLGTSSTGCVLVDWMQLQQWDVRFDADAPAELDVRVVEDPTTGEGIDLVRVHLDGDHAAWFILDSGSSHVILDDDVAHRLGMPAEGSARVGACKLAASFRRGRAFELGRFRAKDPFFLSFDLDPFLNPFLKEVGADVTVAGIVGYPVLRHAVVEMRYDKGAVLLYDPSEYRLPRGDWTPMRLADDGPVVQGRLEGEREALLFLDTGKSGTLSLSVPFIEREGLLAGRPTGHAQNRRVCGVEDEREGILDWVELGSERFDYVRTRFRLPGTNGGDADRTADAVVGRELLKAFTLVLDYSHRRVALLGPSHAIE